MTRAFGTLFFVVHVQNSLFLSFRYDNHEDKERMIIMSNKKKPTPKRAAPLLVQFGIYTAILFVSNGISSFFPIGFPVPAPVIGLILQSTIS